MVFTKIKLVKEPCSNWEEAISYGVDLLVENNCAKKELKTAIIETVNQHGPYFVIAPKLALAHAPPKAYCLKPALSLVVFKVAVAFSNDEKHNVNILVTLSAPDSSSHIDLIAKFAKTFSNKLVVDQLISANSVDEIKNILGD